MHDLVRTDAPRRPEIVELQSLSGAARDLLMQPIQGALYEVGYGSISATTSSSTRAAAARTSVASARR